MIGLSGLITPSLDEMVYVASEMKKAGMTQPLLIGGATTSAAHTAVKIVPSYDQPVVHVPDASLVTGVLGKLMSKDLRADYVTELSAAQIKIREDYLSGKKERSLLPIAEARAKAPQLKAAPVKLPNKLGITLLDNVRLGDLVPYFDWSPFFMAWELRGRYPRILEDEVVGKEATKLFNDAQKILAQILRDKPFTPRGVVGIFPCKRDGDDVIVYADENRDKVLHKLHFLRQQKKKDNEQVYYSLADYIGENDYIGGFAVTAGDGAGEYAAQFEKKNDDYSAIMVKALADRFAEAFAEYAHEMVRKLTWGYAADEKLDIEGLIKEEYVGIRPAPGYPASPDHTEKRTLFNWLSVEKNTGIRLTENFAMTPPSSVSGLYFAHPQARYFAVDMITKEQVEDYARRKGWTPAEAERWLAPNLGYNPED